MALRKYRSHAHIPKTPQVPNRRNLSLASVEENEKNKFGSYALNIQIADVDESNQTSTHIAATDS